MSVKELIILSAGKPRLRRRIEDSGKNFKRIRPAKKNNRYSTLPWRSQRADKSSTASLHLFRFPAGIRFF
jgi:hypothetical protein